MATDGQNRPEIGNGDEERHAYGGEQNASAGVEGEDDVVADNDASQRASGDAGRLAGAGIPGLGGNPGGTADAGGVGLPGGARNLGTGAAPTSDTGQAGTPQAGGLGTPGNAAAGSGEMHPAATPDAEPHGPAHAMEYPHTPQRPSDHDHGGELSLAGGSAGSGGGSADLLSATPPYATDHDGGADVERPPAP